MKNIILILSFLFIKIFPATSQSNCFDTDIQTYLQFLKQNEQSPEKYVQSKINRHDIIIVGEVHQKKEYCELISKVIASSHIDYFATEFIKSSNTERINKIVTAAEFNRSEAIDIFRDYAWPVWGFKEYLDIIETIWNVNTAINNPQKKIKVIGLDSEWSQYDNMCTEKKSQEILFQQNRNREENMIKSVKNKYSKGCKILVHIGFAHTLYNLKSRFAAELYNDYKTAVFQICLHQQFEGIADKMSISKDIEKVMAANNNVPIGFDVYNSPFAKINDPGCYYFKVPQHKELKDIAMGYVFIKPYAQLSIVTWIPGFVNEHNFEKAKCVSLKMRFIKAEPQSASELNEALAVYFNGRVKKSIY